jgi:MFS transporter, PHS family, inorganic phosphate transporter
MTVASMFWNYPGSQDYIWRTILMLAAVFTAATMYFRLRVPETARYTLYVQRNLEQTNKDMATVLHTHFDSGADTASRVLADGPPTQASYQSTADPAKTAQDERVPGTARLSTRALMRKFGLQLLGCAMCWFLLDIAFYSQSLFQSVIFTEIGWLPPAYTMTAAQEVYLTARAQWYAQTHTCKP